LRPLKIATDGLVWTGTDRGLEALHITGKATDLHFNFEWNFGIVESIHLTEKNIWAGTSNGFVSVENESISIKKINTIKESSVLLFKVSDSGIGMNKRQLKKLFKAFQQGDSSISRKHGGTGLGFYIRYNFVKMMDSELKVQSQEGEGSTFYFTLHLAHAKVRETSISAQKTRKNLVYESSNEILKSSESPLSNEKVLTKNQGFQGTKILVAEDNKMVQLVFHKILKDAGFDVVMASNGKECIDIFEKNQNFDLIFMDIQMPEMDGLQATAYIRKVLKNDTVKIIAFTADITPETREMVIQNGMNDFLTKPIKQEELLEIYQKWIRK